MNQLSLKLFSAILLSILCSACGKDPAVYHSSAEQASGGDADGDYVDGDFDYGTYNPETGLYEPQQPGDISQNEQPQEQEQQQQTPQQMSNIENYLTQLYKNLYGRTPDLNGLDYWLNSYESGAAGCKAITHSFLYADELTGLRNSANNGDRVAKLTFLNLLFRGLLGRASDAPGKAYWIAELDRGYPIVNMEVSFLNSDEFKKRCSSFGLRL